MTVPLFVLWAWVSAWGLLAAGDRALSRRAGRAPLPPGSAAWRGVGWAAVTLVSVLAAGVMLLPFSRPAMPAAEVYAREAGTAAAAHLISTFAAAAWLHRRGRVRDTAVAAPLAAACLLALWWGGAAGLAAAWDALHPRGVDGVIELEVLSVPADD